LDETALDQIANDQRRLAREHLELAALGEGGPGRGNGSWLAAKYHQYFAEHISKDDPKEAPLTVGGFAQVLLYGLQEKEARDWRRWKRFLG
jgi:hypothetical protein